MEMSATRQLFCADGFPYEEYCQLLSVVMFNTPGIAGAPNSIHHHLAINGVTRGPGKRRTLLGMEKSENFDC